MFCILCWMEPRVHFQDRVCDSCLQRYDMCTGSDVNFSYFKTHKKLCETCAIATVWGGFTYQKRDNILYHIQKKYDLFTKNSQILIDELRIELAQQRDERRKLLLNARECYASSL